MFEYLKTPIGSYWLTIIVAGCIWLLSGGGILAGINHYYAKIRDAERKARVAESASKDLRSSITSTKEELAATAAALQKTKAETDELRNRLAYRIITDQQAEAFLVATHDSPKGKFIMKFRAGDDEAEQFARQIGSLLLDAGFEPPEGPTLTGVMNGSTAGVSIDVEDSKGVMDHGSTAVAGLRAIGIDAQPTKSRYQDAEGIISITVGLKPRNE